MTLAQELTLALTLLLGIVNLIWNIVAAARARRFSVEDDFWFRKVIGPFVVEKSIAFMEKWAPLISALRTQNRTAAKTTLASFKDEKNTLVENFICIKLISPDYYKVACQHLDLVEDQVAATSYAVGSKMSPPAQIDSSCDAAMQGLRVQIFGLLSGLKALHKHI